MILGGHHDLAPLSDSTYRQIAREHQTYLLEDLWEQFRDRAAAIDVALLESETTRGAIDRLRQEAVKRVADGAELLVLTDRVVYDGERRYLDPHLALSAVDQALKQFKVEPGEENLRRRCSIVLRSASVRNVHDVVLALGMGANGVCPYVMVEVICVDDYAEDVSNLCAALRKGIEKVISTIGIHEVRGYARQFSSIGVRPELAEIFGTQAFAASEKGGVGFTDLDSDSDARHRILKGDEESKPAKTFRFYPKVYKAAVAAANGTASYADYSEKVRELEAAEPDLDAPRDEALLRPRADRPGRGRPGRGPARLPDRDLLDELRIAVRAGVPLLRGGRQGDEHPLRQRRGRRDPGHVRPLPQVARPAGRLGPLRRLGRDAERLVPGRDQDRPGREAGRGRPPAGQEGLREGRRRA